jgi:hypothetical protein
VPGNPELENPSTRELRRDREGGFRLRRLSAKALATAEGYGGHDAATSGFKKELQINH